MAQVKNVAKKSILISVKPSYARMIIEGSKTIELRRRFTETMSPDMRILVYSTSPIKQIIGECQLQAVHRLPLGELWHLACRDAMISWSTFKSYFDGLQEGYGLVLKHPRAFDNPISLNELRAVHNTNPPQSFRTVSLTL
jgi:predicted transcriptional regulator